jgi:hypothetical protein
MRTKKEWKTVRLLKSRYDQLYEVAKRERKAVSDVLEDSFLLQEQLELAHG